MKKDYKINPVGLKGSQLTERMKELMGVSTINENVGNSAIQITKLGPDGKVYAIVRENHQHFIKTSNKTTDLVAEDFNYIGGLQNKNSEAYPTYAKAIKQLNMKFNSICESYGIVNTFNTFEDDNLLSEGAAKEATKHIVDKAGDTLASKAKEGKEEDGFGDNIADKKVIDEYEDVTLTEDEMAIDAMIGENYGMVKVAEDDLNHDSSNDDIMSKLDGMSAMELLNLLGDAGKDALSMVKGKIQSGVGSIKNKLSDMYTESEFDASFDEEEISENEDENVDYTMGRTGDDQLPNPASEINIDEKKKI
jgi:hypothetical protein